MRRVLLQLLVAISVSASISFSIGWIIYPENGLSFCFDKKCFDFFQSFFDLPIKVFLFSFTIITIVFSFSRLELSHRSLEIQSRSFQHEAYQSQLRDLTTFLATYFQQSHDSVDIGMLNIRKLHNFFYPGAHATGNLMQESAGIENVRLLSLKLEQFETDAELGSFEKPAYIVGIQKIFDDLGITAHLEDPESARDAELEAINLVNHITSKWMIYGERMLKNEYFHHNLV